MSVVEFDIENTGIAVMTINRPHVRNALNWEAMREFSHVVEEAQRIPDLRALIVTGAGNTFVSGGDLSELQHYPTASDGLQLATIMGDALQRLDSLPCPTIAAINGPARGGGAEIAVACDIRLIAEDADIGFVHARLGIITAWGGGQRLMRIVGYARALEIMTTARVLAPMEAYDIQLVNGITPVGQALLEARRLAQQIASNPLSALKAAKRSLRVGLYQPEESALEAERAEFPPLWDSDFRRQAVDDFLSKRKPDRSNGRNAEENILIPVRQAGKLVA